MKKTALVLSGGGARGAYEAGVVQGIVEVLGRAPAEPGPFQLFAGTSVGAINATYLAAQAHRGDLAVEHLISLWTSLSVGRHLRLAPWPFSHRALLDVGPIEALIRDGTDWEGLRRNVDTGVVKGLMIAALHVDDGLTTLFVDLAPGWRFVPSRDPRRTAVHQPITHAHVLASAAIPGVFPPKEIDGRLYFDGGLRFNTPMSPAIRAGADRLVVVSPLYQGAARQAPEVQIPAEVGPDALFLAGKMLNAVLLDPFTYDLQVLKRFNTLLEICREVLPSEDLRRLDDAVRTLRGVPYRPLRTLVIAPSEDLGAIAVDHLHTHRRGYLREGWGGWLLTAAARRLERSGTDLLSYLLFDGAFTEHLAAVGRRDALARASEIEAFFAEEEDNEGPELAPRG